MTSELREAIEAERRAWGRVEDPFPLPGASRQLREAKKRLDEALKQAEEIMWMYEDLQH